MSPTTHPASAGSDAGAPDLLDLVMTALEATGRIPISRPRNGPSDHMHRDNLAELYLELHPGGWVANVSFRDVPAGLPDTVGTPDACPFESEQLAFLAGARIVCEIVTGSQDLPFFFAGGKLICVAYRA